MLHSSRSGSWHAIAPTTERTLRESCSRPYEQQGPVNMALARNTGWRPDPGPGRPNVRLAAAQLAAPRRALISAGASTVKVTRCAPLRVLSAGHDGGHHAGVVMPGLMASGKEVAIRRIKHVLESPGLTRLHADASVRIVVVARVDASDRAQRIDRRGVSAAAQNLASGHERDGGCDQRCGRSPARVTSTRRSTAATEGSRRAAARAWMQYAASSLTAMSSRTRPAPDASANRSAIIV